MLDQSLEQVIEADLISFFLVICLNPFAGVRVRCGEYGCWRDWCILDTTSDSLVVFQKKKQGTTRVKQTDSKMYT